MTKDEKRLIRARRGLYWSVPILGILLIPALAALEQDWGLEALFTFRGEQAPPAGVIVVGIDADSGDFLGRPGSRLRHAAVIDTLNRAGASLIILDLFLDQESDEDERLSAAFRDAGNIVVTARLDRDTQPTFDRQVLRRPTPLLTSSILDVAPWLVPEEDRINWVIARDASDQFTLPFVILQAEFYEEFVELFRAVAPLDAEQIPTNLGELAGSTLNDVMQNLRATILSDQQFADRLLAQAGNENPALRMLIDMYAGRSVVRQNRLYLNYYGRPRTVTTISYEDVSSGRFSEGDSGLEGAVVFVGYSALDQPTQDDEYPYVYTSNGFRISGVEMGATAYANLRDGIALRELPPAVSVLVVLVWGLALAVILDRFRFWQGVALSGMAYMVYGTAALALFRFANIWLPLVVPGTQALFAVGASLRVRQLRERAYLSVSTAEEAAQALSGKGRPWKDDYRVILHADEQDSKKWTRKVERELDADQILAMLTEFARMRDEAITANGGSINHLLADSMLASWIVPNPDSRDLREQVSAACRAALWVQTSVEAFNAAHPGFPLFLRLGLHAGRVLSGLNPSPSLKDWRMQGQSVNAAERLESLNKVLGTRILISDKLASCLGPGEFWAPVLGTFVFCDEADEILVDPVVVHELDFHSNITEQQAHAAGHLADALRAIERRDWSQAKEKLKSPVTRARWESLVAFYRAACAESAQDSKGGWSGIVKVTVSDKLQRLDRYLE